MKAFPALRVLAYASILSLVGVTKSSAQLFFHVVDLDSATVDSGNNLGVAIDAKFEINYAGLGSLRLTLTNRAGTAKNAGEGGGNYTSGILTGFGFDAPTGATYIAGSFTQALGAGSGAEPGGIDFIVDAPYTETNPIAVFDLGAASAPPAPENGVSGSYTAVFTFNFNGDLSHFNQTDFFKFNGTDADFGFRFQSVGVNGSGSDKFAYYIDDNPPIPEPSTYGLVAAAGLLAIAGARRLKRAKSK